MIFPRSSGILLHPTSLPGPFGIGDLGPAAYAFADYLVTSAQSLWQMLPLGPTGYGDSPYACYSAFAGNTLLISPEQLVAERLLSPSDFPQNVSRPAERVNFERVHQIKDQLLRNMVQKLMIFSTGGDIQFADREVVENIIAKVRPKGGGLRSIIHEIVGSRVFSNK